MKLRPKVARAVWAQARRMHLHGEPQYPAFLQEAREVLANRVDDPQFAYIVRRIWMSADLEDQDRWRQFIAPKLRAEYERIDGAMNWTGEFSSIGATWITPQLVQRTLSLWQPRVPVSLCVRSATRLLQATGRLLDLGMRA